jgi:hypothetical protein
MLAELRREREQIEEAIRSLEQLVRGRAGCRQAAGLDYGYVREEARPPARQQNQDRKPDRTSKSASLEAVP